MATTEPTPGEQAAAISRLLVRTIADYTGRGPMKARTTLGVDVITVVLDDSLSRAEKALIADGSGAEVISLRRAFQRAISPVVIAGVEEITGRQVLAFLSDHHVDPDIATEVFVMRPLGTEVDDPDDGAVAGTPGHRAPSR